MLQSKTVRGVVADVVADVLSVMDRCQMKSQVAGVLVVWCGVCICVCMCL